MSVLRVTFTGIMPSGIMQNVVHFNNPDGLVTNAAFAAYLQTNWLTPLLGFQSTSFVWDHMSIQTVTSPGGVATTHAISPNQGTQAGDASSPFVAALWKLQTDTPGRHGRGRIFIPGLPIGLFSSAGRLTTGSYNVWQTGYLNAFRPKFLFGGSAPCTLVVIPRSDPSAYKFVTSIDVRTWSAVQRRRNYFIGT